MSRYHNSDDTPIPLLLQTKLHSDSLIYISYYHTKKIKDCF